jgi:hypothetical protein
VIFDSVDSEHDTATDLYWVGTLGDLLEAFLGDSTSENLKKRTGYFLGDF